MKGRPYRTILALLIPMSLIFVVYLSTSEGEGRNRNLYTINSTRLSLQLKYCSGITVSISSQDKTNNEMYMSTAKGYLSGNSSSIVLALGKSKYSNVITQLQTNSIGTFVYIAPFIIGLLVVLLGWPCLLCCCMCQGDCPPKCCRSRNSVYANEELTWPTVFLVLLSFLLIATCVPALTTQQGVFGQFGCSLATFLDNFYNGASTSDGKYYFSGITTIRSQLTTVLSPKLSAVNTQVSRLIDSAGTVMESIKQDVGNVLTSLSTLPNGGNTLIYADTYNYPLGSSSTVGTLTSNIGGKLGVFTDTKTNLGSLYKYMSDLLADLTSITTAASTVTPQLTAGNMGAQISATDTVLNDVQTNLDTMRDAMQPVLSLFKDADKYIANYLFAVFGAVLGVAGSTILGVMILKCFKCLCCRHWLYLLCMFSVLLCILLFVLALILGVSSASMFYTCDYMNGVFSSPTSFQSKIDNLFGSSYSNITYYFSQCFGGSNNFMTSLNPTLSGQLNNLVKSVGNSHNYNFTTYTSTANSKLGDISTLIDSVGKGSVPDFDTSLASAEISNFNQIASKFLFISTCPSSTYNIFWQDVWVPGVSPTYQGLVSCLNKTSQDASVCSSGISSTASCPQSRCMNTFSIIDYYYRSSTVATLITDSNTRYGTCTAFTDYLNNFHNNYVKKIVDRIGRSDSALDVVDTTKLVGRFIANAKTPITSINTKMNGQVKSLFNEVYGNLSTTHNLQTIFDTESGVITGLDCRLLNQNANTFKDVLCIKVFNSLYFYFIITGILAFGSLFLSCCLVCVAVRHYQKSLQQIHDEKQIHPLPLQETADIIKIMGS